MLRKIKYCLSQIVLEIDMELFNDLTNSHISNRIDIKFNTYTYQLFHHYLLLVGTCTWVLNHLYLTRII